jgi:hypothetical protein
MSMADAEMTWEQFSEMVLAGGGHDAAVADTRSLRPGDADAAFRVASHSPS